MTALKAIFCLLRRCLMGLFIGYWLILICYTAEKFATGGSNAVVGWYMHIDASPEQVFAQWSWAKFLGRQLALLGITSALFFVELRSKRTLAPE